jgi:glycosidase
LVAVAALTAAACRGGAADTTVAPPTTQPPPTTTLPATPATARQAGLEWWNDRVFYEVFVRSFKDSDGDGIGDFIGLTESLDYLNDGDPAATDDLGVTGIWLMPFNASPSYHGYDVVDYRVVNPDYGTMADFEAFLAAAHQRGIVVLMDFVINHTGRDHPWFQASAAGDPEYADWYLWSDRDPGTTGPWGQQVWHEQDGRYYFGLFWEGMPDLNLENPAVTSELRDIASFWLNDVGVDGFRLDAARHLIEAGTVMADTPATVAWLEGFNAYVDGVAPEALVLGEVWSPTLNVASYVPDGLDLAFEFDLGVAGGRALGMRDAAVYTGALERVVGAYPDGQYAVFLTNHDMNRIMSELGGNVAAAKLAATALLTSPGVPFIYYGEEVGLQGVKPDERIRTPMPWTGEAPGLGFTDGTPWEPPYDGYEQFNVATQHRDPASLLNHYRALIRARSASPALRYGDVIQVETGSRDVFAYLRTIGEDHVLVVANLAPEPVAGYALDLATGPLEGMRGVDPIVGPAAGAPHLSPAGGFLAYRPLDQLPPFGTLVLRFTEAESPPPPPTTTTTTQPDAATADDVFVVRQFWDLMAGGDTEGWLALTSPDAVARGPEGSIGLFEPLPPDAAVVDWNEDGVSTISDVISTQVAFGIATGTELSADCGRDGRYVTCRLVDADLLYDAAGVAPIVTIQSLRVDDGLIVEVVAAEEEDPDQALISFEAWLAQYGLYEAWVEAERPDVYEMLFQGPCCELGPDGAILTRQTLETHTELIQVWARQAAG